jgi:hypothetical protein
VIVVPATLLATGGGLPASITRQQGQECRVLVMPTALLAASGSLTSAIARNALAIASIWARRLAVNACRRRVTGMLAG